MRVLLAQLAPTPGEPQTNASAVRRALERFPEADLAVFPELFLDGYEPRTAHTWPDRALECVAASAAKCGTAVIFGFCELTADGWANATALLDRRGEWLGTYRKTHLFGDLERNSFVAGDTLRIFELDRQRVAPLICFDIEFPEPARALAVAGASVFVTCSANMHPYGADHALAARARALDNRLPHVYVNRVGTERGLQFVGGSAVIDGGGRVVTTLGAAQEIRCVELPDSPVTNTDVDYLTLLRPGLPVVGGLLSTAGGGHS